MGYPKPHRKVYYYVDGTRGRLLYVKRHRRFTEKDVPMLFESYPFREKLKPTAEYGHWITSRGIHIIIYPNGYPQVMSDAMTAADKHAESLMDSKDLPSVENTRNLTPLGYRWSPFSKLRTIIESALRKWKRALRQR